MRELGAELRHGQELDDASWRAVIRQMVEQHESGASDHSTPLWALLMYDAFLRNTMGESKIALAA